MSNYYVRRTGDDSDYLEHMVVQGSGGTNGRPSWRARAHKYISKINIGGKVRYIYDQAQLARVNAGKFIDRNITGASARGRMNRLGSQRQRMLKGSGRGLNGVNQAYNKAKSSYNRSLAGRIGNAAGRIGSAANAARNFVGQQATRARNAGKSFAGTVTREAYKVPGRAKNFVDRNITGASARGRMNRLGSQRQRMLKGSGRGLNGVNQAYNKAKSSYNRSLAGRIGNAANAVGKFADQQRDRAVNAYENASDWMEKQRKKAGVKARVAKKKLKNKASKTKSNVKNASKNAYLGFKNITTGRKA